MTRDYDLIRSILLAVEAMPAGEIVNGSIELKGLSKEPTLAELMEHIKLLIDAGFIEGKVLKFMGGEGTFIIESLTWTGQDFVAAMRDNTLWNRAKKEVFAVTTNVALSFLNAWLQKAALGQ